MRKVFVISKDKRPLMPCHPARARELLRSGKAAVFRLHPFTLILKHRKEGAVQKTEVKLDPGSNTSGVAVVIEAEKGRKAVWVGNLEHRGMQIRRNLLSRRQIRRSRRNRKTRYRQPRFLNRTSAKSQKTVKGFRTGDFVKAVVTKGKKIGTYRGKVSIRVTGSFNIKNGTKTVQGISYRYCSHIQKADGYSYQYKQTKKVKEDGFSSPQ